MYKLGNEVKIMAMPEEQFLHTYSYSLLRNIEVQSLLPILRANIEDTARSLRETAASNSWDRIAQILNTQLHYHAFDDTLFDNALFEHILWNQDHLYLLQMQTELTIEEAMERLTISPALNRKLRQRLRSDEKVSSIRRQGNKIIIMFKLGVAYLGRTREQCTFYVPCEIDYDRNLIQIRLKENMIGKASFKLKGILNLVQDYVNNQLLLDISLSFYNPTHIHKMLYNIFSNESANAETIIKSHIEGYLDANFNQEITTFLAEKLLITEPGKYIDRVKSILLQNTSEHLELGEYYNGFIFGFTFFDRNLIKSLTRNPTREPIYNSPVYWNLKDLIHEEEEVKQLSVYWRFDRNNFDVPPGDDFEFVEISIEETYNCIEIHFYNKQYSRRELKERYVIRTIMQNLPR
jgi:hypothetical protein